MDDIIYSYSAEDAERDGILHNIKHILENEGITVRITPGIKDYLLTGDLQETDRIYRNRVREIAQIAITELKKTRGDWFAQFKLEIDNYSKKVWACVDTTSGPAIHIMFPEEY